MPHLAQVDAALAQRVHRVEHRAALMQQQSVVGDVGSVVGDHRGPASARRSRTRRPVSTKPSNAGESELAVFEVDPCRHDLVSEGGGDLDGGEADASAADSRRHQSPPEMFAAVGDAVVGGQSTRHDTMTAPRLKGDVVGQRDRPQQSPLYDAPQLQAANQPANPHVRRRRCCSRPLRQIGCRCRTSSRERPHRANWPGRMCSDIVRRNGSRRCRRNRVRVTTGSNRLLAPDPGEVALSEAPVGAADAAGFNSDQRISRTDCRIVELAHDERLADIFHHDGFRQGTPSRWRHGGLQAPVGWLVSKVTAGEFRTCRRFAGRR